MEKADETLEQLLDLVKQQRTFLDMYVRSWSEDYRSDGGSLFCGKGCSNCCTLAVHTGFAEALAVARQLNEEQEKAVAHYADRLRYLVQGVHELADYLRLHRREIGSCPLLDAVGACGVYPTRPLSCRALISTRESTWCGTDFAQLSGAEREAFVAGLDRKVVAFPSHYVSALMESGKELEDAGAKRMGALLGFALYGNLGVLVHLIRTRGLAEACLQGPAQVADVIGISGFDHPLLITISQGIKGDR